MVKEKPPLRKHQLEAVRRAINQNQFGLFFEVGAGKTAAAIEIYRQWCIKRNKYLRCLVIGPNIIVDNWQREFDKFSLLGDRVTCLKGTGKARKMQLDRHGVPVLVASYETISIKSMTVCFEEIKNWRPEVVIIDESHRIKSHVAKRTKAAIELCEMAQYRMILTGTPILNSLLDLYTQVQALGKHELFGQNIFEFQRRFFYDNNAGMPSHHHWPDWRPRENAEKEIRHLIKPFTMSIKKSECLDLPPLVRQEVFVELAPAQRKAYEEMKRDFVTFFDDKACTAQLALTKALRLQQIASGFIALEGEEGKPKNEVFAKNPRSQALRELLEDITPEHKCIVWAVFRENYETIRCVCRSLNIPYVELHGGIPAERRQKAIDDFETDPAIRVFISHPGSGGIGINLVSAACSIFYSKGFSLEQDLQAEARNHRSGSEIHEKITRIDIIAQGTIDEIITERLANKIEIGNKVLKDIAMEL